MLFPFGSENTLAIISTFGYTMFVFLNGVQMDFSMITRTGKKAWIIAISTLVIPFVVGTACFRLFVNKWEPILGKDLENLQVVVINQSSCYFPVIASFLTDLDILNSELGRLVLSAALVSDITTSFLTGIPTAFVSTPPGQSVLWNLGLFAAFLILVPLIGRPAMKLVVKSTPEGRPVKKIYTYSVVLMGFFLGYLATYFKQPYLAGPVVLGLVVPEGPPLGSELVKQFELFSNWFFFPIAVTTSIMKLDITRLGKPEEVATIALFIFLIYLIKCIMCMGVSWHCHMPITDGFCLFLILSAKGAMDVCIYTFLFDTFRISSNTVTVMVIAGLVFATLARIGVKILYDPSRKYAGYQKRNILHLKPNSELKVVACIHKPFHMAPIRSALDLCCPTSSNPLVAHVLHLMELVGRASPLFISHRLQEKLGSGHFNFSGDLIVTFSLFEHDYAGAAVVNTYTAVSPKRLMHEDICYLALDNLASIIILPFHVRWAEDGSIESEDDGIRSLNSRVLARAPCSVGILASRVSSSNNTPTQQVAMIFLGGPDDREALCLAKRSIKDSNCNLAVYHLIASDSQSTSWDLMLDDEVLKDVKGAYGSLTNVTYERIVIEDASQTTNLLSDIGNMYNFIIVGRRYGVKSSQTGAHENWTEYAELGVIGDLLVSPDTNARASILVVQQQQMSKS